MNNTLHRSSLSNEARQRRRLRLINSTAEYVGKLFNYLDLVATYVRFNFRSQMEYRSAFVTQVVAMFINDCFWIAFWITFFNRFPVPNWSVADVVTMWTVVAAGFGLGHGLSGNALVLPRIIMRGELDTWKLYPRLLLSHVLLGSTHPAGWGDLLFGFVAYAVLVNHDLPHLLMFTLMTICVAIAMIGFSVMSASAAFFVGNGESLTENWRFALLTFSTYPPPLFDKSVKILLYTVIPAGFCGWLPVEAVRTLSPVAALECFAGAVALLAVGTLVFNFGLSRYESGNLMDMRG